MKPHLGTHNKADKSKAKDLLRKTEEKWPRTHRSSSEICPPFPTETEKARSQRDASCLPARIPFTGEGERKHRQTKTEPVQHRKTCLKWTLERSLQAEWLKARSAGRSEERLKGNVRRKAEVRAKLGLGSQCCDVTCYIHRCAGSKLQAEIKGMTTLTGKVGDNEASWGPSIASEAEEH